MKKVNNKEKNEWREKYTTLQERQVLLRRMTTELLSSKELSQSLKKIASFLIPYFGDFCNISIINEKNEIERIDSYHLDKRKTSLLKKIVKEFEKSSPPMGTRYTIETTKPEFVPDNAPVVQMFKEKYPKIYPLARELNAKAYITVPIVGRKKTIGVIAVASVTKHYTKEDFEFAKLIAERLALVIENTRLYTETQKKIVEYKNKELEIIKESEKKSAFLAEVSKILDSSLDFQMTLRNVAHIAVPEVADWCFIDLMDEKGTMEEPMVYHTDPKKAKLGLKFRKKYAPNLSREELIMSVVRTGKPLHVPYIDHEYRATFAANQEQLDYMDRMDVTSVISVAIIVLGKSIGAITFCTSGNRARYKESDVAFLEDLASRAAGAIENSKLHQRAQKAISETKESEEKWSFLARASKILASSLDFKTTLKNVAHLAVPEVADWSMIDLKNESGTMRDPVVVHMDPKKVELGFQFRKKYAPNLSKEELIMIVVRTGKPLFVPYIDHEYRATYAKSQEQLDYMDGMDVTSVICVPLLVRGNPIGAITLCTSGSRPRYKQSDVPMFEELASRASMAIENATLHQRARRAVAIRDDFMSIASHELKTPITSVKMYAQFLKRMYENSPDTEKVDYFIRMDEQIDKMSALIADLLDVSRIEHGKFELKMGKFSLDDEVKSAVQVCQATTNHHKIRIEGKIGKTVRGDRARVSQVLINFLNNAISYSPDADSIIVRLKPTDKEAFVSVQDFGIGIEKEDIPRLFEPFYRSAGVEKEAMTSPGLGIGLYVSSQIVRKHGSRIAVESEKGKGSTFSFTLQYA